jgi:flagellar motor protein MotB
MSHKKQQVVPVILIELDEYFKLLSLEERVKKQEDQLSVKLQTNLSDKQPAEVPKDLPDSAEEPAEPETSLQTGAGALENSNSISSDILKKIYDKIFREISSEFNLTPSNRNIQEGAGAGDLMPELPEAIPEKEPQINPVQSANFKKSQLHDEFDDQKLIELVPAGAKKRAGDLLKELKQFSSDISWTSNGVILIDQQSLPESNIFNLFPKLFKRLEFPDKVLYLDTVAAKIATLGLGRFINKRLTLGLSRRKVIPEQGQYLTEIKQAKHWWFLGQ